MKKTMQMAATMAVMFLVTTAIADLDDSSWRDGPSKAWFVNWDKALAEAKKTGKALFLLNTGSDWCGWCKRLRANVLDKPEFAEFARKNLVLVYLDSPNRPPLGKEQKAHNRQIVKALPFGGGVPHVLVMNVKGEKLGAIGGGGLGLDEYLEKLRGILAGKGSKVDGKDVQTLFGEGYGKMVEEIATRRAALPPVTTNDFKAVLTGMAVVEKNQRYGKKDGIEFLPPDAKLEVPYDKRVLFRVEYDFPEGYEARVWTQDGTCDDGKSHSWYFGSNPSGMYKGKGTAYGFLSLLDRGKTCRVKELLLKTNTAPELDDYPHGWTIATVPVDVGFLEKPEGVGAKGQDDAANRPGVSKYVPKGWTEDFEAARRLAAKEGRFVLVAFSGSDWCGPCMALEREVFSQREFVDEASKGYVLVMVSSPRDDATLSALAASQNGELKKRYAIHGFPTVVVVDPADGNEVKRHSGYRSGSVQKYLNTLNELMDGVQWPEKGTEVKPIARLGAKANDRKREEIARESEKEPSFELRSGRVVFTGPESLREDIRGAKERYESLLPFVRRIYGDEESADGPFVVRFNRKSGGYRPGLEEWNVYSGSKGSCDWFWRKGGSTIYYMASCVHNGPKEPNWAFIAFYLDYFVQEAAGELRATSAQAAIDNVLQGKSRDSAASWMKARLPHFAVFRELFEDAPSAFRRYYREKRSLFEKGLIGRKMSMSDEAAIFSRILGRDVFHVFLNHGIDVSRQETRIPLE